MHLLTVFSSPGRRPGRAIVLSPASALVLASALASALAAASGVSKMLKFYIKDFYVMGKGLSGELFCP